LKPKVVPEMVVLVGIKVALETVALANLKVALTGHDR